MGGFGKGGARCTVNLIRTTSSCTVKLMPRGAETGCSFFSAFSKRVNAMTPLITDRPPPTYRAGLRRGRRSIPLYVADRGARGEGETTSPKRATPPQGGGSRRGVLLKEASDRWCLLAPTDKR